MKLAKFNVTLGPDRERIDWIIYVDPQKVRLKRWTNARLSGCKHRKGWFVMRIPAGELKPISNSRLAKRLKKKIQVCPCEGYLVKEAKQ